MVLIEVFIEWLITTSLKGSLLVGIIILVKRLLETKMGARGHYYLWLLLVIKLIMPFSLQSKASIFNLLNLNRGNFTTAKSTIFSDSGQAVGLYGENAVLDRLLFSTSFLHSRDFKILLIWLVGVIVFTIITIRVNYHFRKRINLNPRPASPEILLIFAECKKKMKVTKKINVLFAKEVESPVLVGLWKTKILIPAYLEKELSPQEYQHIFLHELAHYKRKDIPIFCLINAVQILHWFNPILWYGFSKMRQDCEIACDALVLSKLQEGQRKSYGQTIIHLLQDFKVSFQPIVKAGIVGNRSQFKRRIKMIKNFNKKSYALSIIPLMIFFLLGFAFLTSATEATGGQSVPGKEIIKAAGGSADNSAEKMEMLWPVPDYNKITSSFGQKIHPKTKEEAFHTGIDIAAPMSKDIIAAADGKVLWADWQEGYGKTVIIDHGQGITTVYSHCSELLAEKEAEVKAGEKIAEIGSTGYSTGPHLHFEVRENAEPVDPLQYTGYVKE